MTDTLIIVLGLAAAFVLIGGVGVTAYSRMKSFSRKGVKLDELLTSLEDDLEETRLADTIKQRKNKKKPDAGAADKAEENDEKPSGANAAADKKEN